MKINKQELLDAIIHIQPGLANKEIIEQSQSIVFDNDVIRSYNDEISVLCPFQSGLSGAVPSVELSKYLAKVKDEELDIAIEDNELIVQGKKNTAGINFTDEISLPFDELDEEVKWIKLPSDFCEGINFSLFCTSKDMSKLVLTCLSIDKNIITACDNFRITQYEMEGAIKKPILLPASSAFILLRYEPIKYAIGNGWLHFQNDHGVKFSCRTVSIEYPDITALMEVEGDEIQLPRTLEDMLEEVEVFSKGEFEQDDVVDIEIADGELIIKAKSLMGWAEHSKRISYDGKDISFQVRPIFLLQACKLMNKIIIGEKKLKIEGENFKHIACLKG